VKVSAQWALGLVCLLALFSAACGGGEDKAAASLEAGLAPLQEQKSALDAKRAELAELKEQLATAETAEPAADEAGEEGEAAPTAEELAAQVEAMQGEINGMSDDFMTAVVGFINSVELYEGEPIPEPIQAAINMKSAEDMVYAAEYIWEGGEYRRAIEILDTALMLDPDNEELKAAREKAEADQYMTEERFAAVAKGMTQNEVRRAIGTVSRHNLREYPEKNVVAWFYRREDKGAAGVWFEEKDGVMKVYKSDFNAIERPEEEGEGE
jgi:tetratricopeptide (TPR) repeat protein